MFHIYVHSLVHLLNALPLMGFCLGPSKGLSQDAANLNNSLNTAMGQAGVIFGKSSGVFNDLQNSFAPQVAAGPNAVNMVALNAANDLAINQTAGNYLSAANAVKSALPGGGIMPSGFEGATLAQLSEAGAQQLSNEELQNYMNAQTRAQQQYEFAAQGLAGAPNVFNPATSAQNAASTAGQVSTQAQEDVTNAQNSWEQLATSAISGVTGSLMPGGVLSKLIPSGGGSSPAFPGMTPGGISAAFGGPGQVPTVASPIPDSL